MSNLFINPKNNVVQLVYHLENKRVKYWDEKKSF